MTQKHQQSTQEMFQLMDKGLTAEQARAVVLPHKPVSKQGNYLLERKYKEYALTNPRKVKKASRIYENALDGKPLTPNSDEKPSDSQVLAVAKEVMDRAYPKITINQNLNINADLSPVDLEKYRLR